MTVFYHLPLQERPELLRFCGYTAGLTEAAIVVFGAPYDSSSSFRPGSRFAPAEMRRDSWGLESWSPQLKRDLEDHNVHDAGDLELPFASSEEALRIVRQTCAAVAHAGKIPLMIGGEHTLTLSAIAALLDLHPDLHLLHFDAHTDLRTDYLGVELSHASVIRRIYELLGEKRIHSLGIRSGLAEEFTFAEKNLDFHPFDLSGMEEAVLNIGSAPVYVSLDLDVLDPSVMPGTGTAEPGGVSYEDLVAAIYKLENLNIVGSDMMELAPSLDPSGASTAVAVKLLREMILVL
ncbi:MAG: agmatinase [Eubacteriales bacterium]|nr:agmatinase [Eubacteriales bacterium]